MSRLVRSAHDNGVDVDGGWDVPGDERYPDWSTELYEIAEHRGEQ